MPADWNNHKSQTKRRKGCPICNKPTAGMVRVIGQKFNPNKPGFQGPSIGSISRSLCQEHTIQMYNEMERKFEAHFQALKNEFHDFEKTEFP